MTWLQRIKSLLVRIFWFVFLWWGLADGRFDEPAMVAAIIGLAVATSMLLWPVGVLRWRIGGLLRFIPYFLTQSMLGGWDVARRAFHPNMPLAPGFVDLPLRLSSELAKVFFAWVVSLLPGTANAELQHASLKVHALDTRMHVPERLRHLEEHVAQLFGEALEPVEK